MSLPKIPFMTIPPKPFPGAPFIDHLVRWYTETSLDFKTLDPRGVEIILALYELLFGAWLAIWNTVYSTAPAAYMAISYWSEHTWGCVFLIFGILQYHSSVIRKNDIPFRRVIIWLTMVLFGVMSGSYIQHAFYNPNLWAVFGIPFYLGMTSLAGWVWWRLWSRDHRHDFFDNITKQLDISDNLIDTTA